ncbi:MAG: glycerol-3-phosphate cytidylyltransferase [Homoserinimonas sp.]|jgi:glycerol-3-phosphate cytidylyltransferase|nr:glycerol-3-phosphate cytidylyltransferase [Homoserinimonas sp.]
MIVGYTAGVFDMFHVGHVRLLERASRKCDELMVGVTTDDLSLTFKGKSPIVPYEERREIVAAMSCVDRVIPQASVDKMLVWQEWGFDRLFAGDDKRSEPEWKRWDAEFPRLGVEIIYFPYTKVTSSTYLRASLEAIHGSV